MFISVVELVVLDMDDDEGLTLIKEVIDGPGQRRLAAHGEV